MSGERTTHATVVAAIRLAIEAAESEYTALDVTKELLRKAPVSPPGATAPTTLLVEVLASLPSSGSGRGTDG